MHNRLVKPSRVAGLIILILLLLTVYLVALYKLQIIEGEANYKFRAYSYRRARQYL